jgi:hypothetical protein
MYNTIFSNRKIVINLEGMSHTLYRIFITLYLCPTKLHTMIYKIGGKKKSFRISPDFSTSK